MTAPVNTNHNKLMNQLTSLRENDQMPRPSEIAAKIKIVEARAAQIRKNNESIAYIENFTW